MNYADKLFGPTHQPKNPAAFDKAVKREIETLPDKVKTALLMREGWTTYSGIASRLNININKARQLEAQGLRLLRHPKRGLREL